MKILHGKSPDLNIILNKKGKYWDQEKHKKDTDLDARERAPKN